MRTAWTPWRAALIVVLAAVLLPAAAAGTEPPELRLLAVGDVGTGDEAAYGVAGLAAGLGAADPFDALILLGDNVYPDGDPARLPATVFAPYAPVLEAGAELWPVLGNHDVKDGNGDAHAAALGMPGRWYARRVGDVLFVGLDSTRPDHPGQAAWLEDVLAASDARWKIVALHHPPYSAGRHGSELAVRSAFVPAFERHGVHLVLAGHDHDYQRTVPIAGVTYVVSGGGSSVRPTGHADFTAAAGSELHVLDIRVSADRLTVRAVGHDGTLDAGVIFPQPAGTRCAGGRRTAPAP